MPHEPVSCVVCEPCARISRSRLAVDRCGERVALACARISKESIPLISVKMLLTLFSEVPQ